MGTNYYQNDAQKIMQSIGKESPYWRKTNREILDYIQSNWKDLYRYYKVVTNDVKIVREPNNKHDKNALKVTVNNKLAGYIPAEIAKKLNPIFKNQSSYQIIASIKGFGGEYKTLNKSGKSIKSFKKDVSFYLDLSIYQIDKQKQVSAKDETLVQRIINWFKN